MARSLNRRKTEANCVPPIRLVVLLEDLEFGGTQRYALQLLTHLNPDLFAAELWLLRGGTDLAADAIAAGITVVSLSNASRVGPVALARLGWRLFKSRPGLLYTLTAVPNIWGRLFAGVLAIPLVSGYRSLLPRQHERWLYRFSTRIIANAATLKEIMTARFGVEPDRIAIVPNAVDTDYFSPDETRRLPEPLIVCVARLVVEKDLPTLLAAFEFVRAEVPEARLEIVGSGPVALAPAANAHLAGSARDVRPYLRRAWVFALSSVSDASPNAIAEAMACALPVVASRVGGIPELIIDNGTGLLVPPRDPAVLAAALITLLRDDARRKAMGTAGRERVRASFSIAATVRKTEEVLLEVAQRGTDWTTGDDGRVALRVPLWSGPATGAGRGKIVERGKFRPDRSIRTVSTPTLTVFLPASEHATGTGIVVCPGGGYAGVTIDKEGHQVARWLASAGIAAMVLTYRLPRPEVTGDDPPWPIRDVARALELVRERAADWRIDSSRIGAMGFSAGGHMAAAAASLDPAALWFTALIYPVISMEPDLTHPGSRLRLLGRHPSEALVARYSFERRVTARTPPAFLVHASDDTVVKAANSIRYAKALAEAGVPHELLLYDRGGHGFGLGASDGELSAWPARFLAWLRALQPIKPVPITGR